jgi:hypothetical protein
MLTWEEFKEQTQALAELVKQQEGHAVWEWQELEVCKY